MEQIRSKGKLPKGIPLGIPPGCGCMRLVNTIRVVLHIHRWLPVSTQSINTKRALHLYRLLPRTRESLDLLFPESMGEPTVGGEGVRGDGIGEADDGLMLPVVLKLAPGDTCLAAQ